MKARATRKHAPVKRIVLLSAIVLVVIAVSAVWLVNKNMQRVAETAPQPVVTQPGVSKTSTPQPAATPAPAPTTPCTSNTAAKLLLVSISQQHLWACEGSAEVNDSAVTTGTTEIINGVDDATPTGTWAIYSKQTNRYLRGSDANGSWDDYVQYWMPFYGAYGFHDASWQTFAFGSPQYQTDGSHGCVHLPTDFAAWVYDWAPIGTVVTIED